MAQHIRPDEAFGRKVKAIIRSVLHDQMLILFTDDTFLCFGTRETDDGTDIVLSAFHVLDWEKAELIENGLTMEDEWLSEEKKVQELSIRIVEDCERRQYARLKAKYGNEQTGGCN